MNRFPLSVLSFFLLFTYMLCGQNTMEFEKLTGENGVSQSVIYSLQQDQTGNIWMATEEGVIKYNSVYANRYTKQNGLPKEVGNRVRTLFIDSKNRIWLGVENGICIYDAKFDTFKYIVSKNNQIPTLVKSICEDVEGNIWIGGFNGLWLYNPRNSEFVHKILKINKERISIETLAMGSKGNLMLGTHKGLFAYEIKNEKFNLVSNKNFNIMSIVRNKSDYLFGTKNNGLFKVDNLFKEVSKIDICKENYPIRSITKSTNGNIFIGTDGKGIYVLNNEYKLVNHYMHSEDISHSLSSNGVYDVIIDKHDVLWVATYGGGVNFSDKSKAIFQKIKHKPNTVNSIKNSFTRSIEVDSYGRIWFGTKRGISILDPKNNKWLHLKNLENIVLTIERDENIMWVGTFNQGVFKVDIATLKIEKTQIGLKKVYAIYKDSNNNIWFGGLEGDLLKLSKHTNRIANFPISDVRSIIEFEKSILIAGARWVSVITNGEISDYEILEKTKSKLNLASVNVLEPFSKHKLLIGTNGSGLLIYDHKTKAIHRISHASGLPSDIIQGIISSEDDEIWVSTTKGLAQILLSSEGVIIHVFDKHDGLASTDFNYGSYKMIRENLFAFGGVDGVTIFDPNKIHTKKSNLPVIVFDEFSVFNKVISPQDSLLKGHINTVKNIKLKYSENSIAFKYLGVSNQASSKIKYAWKLEGFSENWSAPESNRQVNFTNLNYGDYIFKVKASNGFGEWGSIRELNIKVMRPWWATTMAYLIYFLLIVILFVITIYFTQFILSKKNADEQVEFFNNLTHEIRTPLTILLSSLDSVSGSGDTEANTQVKKTITRLNALFEQNVEL